jgi:hypothetical protein
VSANIAAASAASGTTVHVRGRLRPRVIIPVRLVMSSTNARIWGTFPEASKLVPGGAGVAGRFAAEAKSNRRRVGPADQP